MKTETEARVLEVLDYYERNHRAALEQAEQKYVNRGFDSHSFVKYFMAVPQIREKVTWAVEYLDLDRPFYPTAPNGAEQKLSVLDIGTGMGWLPYVAKYFGHRVILTDLPLTYGESIEGYDDGLKALGLVRAHEFPVRRQTRLPINEGDKFDLITATGIAWHKNWAPEDWVFFLSDLYFHCLYKAGRIFLQLNDTGKVAGGFQALKTLDIASVLPCTPGWLDERTVLIKTWN